MRKVGLLPTLLTIMSTYLPDNYGYVLAGLFATFVADMTLKLGVSAARKKYGVKPPTSMPPRT